MSSSFIRLTATLIAGSILNAIGPVRAQEPGSVQFGLEERVRSESWNNVLDFNRATNDHGRQIRYLTRAWMAVTPARRFTLNVGLADETYQSPGHRTRLGELVFETANVEIRDVLVKNLSLKVGRQDLPRGDGLLLFDGTSGDGSRTSYMNAALVAYTFGRSKIEAMGIFDPRSDHLLPVLFNRHVELQEWDERALAVYYTYARAAGESLDLYFFHKTETRDSRSPADPQYQPDRQMSTAGSRFVHVAPFQLKATAEGAVQWGHQIPDTPIRAWAATGQIRRTFDVRFNPYLVSGYWALSGDDPTQPGRISGWDPIFARWPKWTDLDAFTESLEKGAAYASNIKRWGAGAGFVPFHGLACRFEYYHLAAFHPMGRNPAVFANGPTRGDSLQLRFDVTLNHQLRAHATFQTLAPGDFYAHRDRGWFLRMEVLLHSTRSMVHLKERAAR